MPIYEYRCPICENEFEVIRKWTEKPPQCEACGFSDPERIISKKTTFQLKGTGWYETDYKRKVSQG